VLGRVPTGQGKLEKVGEFSLVCKVSENGTFLQWSGKSGKMEMSGNNFY